MNLRTLLYRLYDGHNWIYFNETRGSFLAFGTREDINDSKNYEQLNGEKWKEVRYDDRFEHRNFLVYSSNAKESTILKFQKKKYGNPCYMYCNEETYNQIFSNGKKELIEEHTNLKKGKLFNFYVFIAKENNKLIAFALLSKNVIESLEARNDFFENPIDFRALKKNFNSLDEDMGYEIHFPINSKIIFGSLDEILERKNYQNVEGKWVIYDYYDHYWSMFAFSKDINERVILKYQRKIPYVSYYGFSSKKDIDQLFLETEEDCIKYEEDGYDLKKKVGEYICDGYWDAEYKYVTSGRGEDSIYVYTAEKNNKIIAFLLLTENLLELFRDEYKLHNLSEEIFLFPYEYNENGFVKIYYK